MEEATGISIHRLTRQAKDREAWREMVEEIERRVTSALDMKMLSRGCRLVCKLIQ